MVPVSMVGAQLMYTPGTHPHGPFVMLFSFFTLPGQLVAGLGSFPLFIAVSVLANIFVFGAIGAWWDKKGKRSQNNVLEDIGTDAGTADKAGQLMG